MQGKAMRIAKHAGSWYKKQKQLLNQQLDNYLSQAQCNIQNISKLKAVIGPHAGFTYSGPVAGWAYQYLKKECKDKNISRIFLLGPSHKKYFKGCSLSGLQLLQTPLGNLNVDSAVVKQLHEKQTFLTLSKKDQENQHSLQMHLPYIFKVFGDSVKIVPVMVGVTSYDRAQDYGKVFSPYFDRDDTIFIISSDFCHWGPHFDYQPHKEGLEIFEYIEKLDKEGMGLIEKSDVQGFDKYIKETENTICGEYPIRILMNTIKSSELKIKTNFVRYDQSEKVKTFDDSSVSYASSISFTIAE